MPNMGRRKKIELKIWNEMNKKQVVNKRNGRRVGWLKNELAPATGQK
jgi:hypothetical protein